MNDKVREISNPPEPGTIVNDADLSHQDFARQDLSGCEFSDCQFVGTNFSGANLADTRFLNCQFNDTASDQPANFSKARLRDARFERCNLTVVDFIQCSGYGLAFKSCQMQGSDLSKSDFRLPVGSSDLAELTITDCNLSFANLSNSYLVGCVLTGNRMLEISLDYCDLTDADLSGSELHNITAIGVQLSGADLRGASFNNLDPTRIDLTGVRLYYSQLLNVLEPLGIVVEDDPQ